MRQTLSEFLRSKEGKEWTGEDTLMAQELVRGDILEFAKSVRGAAVEMLAVLDGARMAHGKLCGTLFNRSGLMMACFRPEGNVGPCSTDQEPV